MGRIRASEQIRLLGQIGPPRRRNDDRDNYFHFPYILHYHVAEQSRLITSYDDRPSGIWSALFFPLVAKRDEYSTTISPLGRFQPCCSRMELSLINRAFADNRHESFIKSAQHKYHRYPGFPRAKWCANNSNPQRGRRKKKREREREREEEERKKQNRPRRLSEEQFKEDIRRESGGGKSEGFYTVSRSGRINRTLSRSCRRRFESVEIIVMKLTNGSR